jgi:cobalt/nickel transport system permease protein
MWQAKSFLDNAQGPLYQIIPDYVFPGVSNQAAACILAGILGTLPVFAWRWVAYRRKHSGRV